MPTLNIYEPYEKQKEVHKVLNDKETFFTTVNAGRQVGKTLLSINQALIWAVRNPDVVVYWVSPSSGQYQKVYKQMLKYIIDIPLLKNYRGSQGDTEIELVNGSVIKFRSSLSGDSLRGEEVHYMILDECADIKKDTILYILLPMMNVKGRKILSVGTPKGKNFFYEMYIKGNTDNPKYKSFKFTSYDNPFADVDTIEFAKSVSPPALFSQEFMGEFVDEAAIFQNINKSAVIKTRDKPLPGERVWIGVDLALSQDYNVFTVLNNKGEVIHYERFNNTTTPILIQRLISLYNTWKPVKMLLELNNIGQSIFDMLKYTHKLQRVEGFTTTSKSKPEIITNLMTAFSLLMLKIPNDELYKDEMKMMTMYISGAGTVKYSAPNGYHDDIPMSLAIAWYCFNNYKQSGFSYS